MFSSSNSNNGNCFGEHSYGFISPSSFQLGSSSSPAFLEENQFFVTDHTVMSQGHQPFLLGHDGGKPDDHLTLIGYDHDFMDGVMVASSVGNDNVSCGKVMEEEVGRAKKNQTKDISAKRICTGKKDRHSKIYTAQGPRDRRMRLSLQIARKFFDLQDKLGFNKASKTIEWLFSMSKNAISEVMGNTCSRMDERIDGTSNIFSDNNAWKNHLGSPWSEYGDASDDIMINHKTYNCEDRADNKHCRSKKLRRSHNLRTSPQLRKDDRDKARARARERTMEKIRLKALKDSNQGSLTTTSPEKNATSILRCRAFEQIDSSSAQSQLVDELIQYAGLEEIEDARLYSSYMFHDITPQHQDVLSSTRYQS